MLIRSLCALALLAGAATAAKAEQIEPFECRQVDGPAPELALAPAIALTKRGILHLVCPFKANIAGYRVRFSDPDATSGNQSVKVALFQLIDTGQPNSVPINNPSLFGCEFRSNFHPLSHERAEITCPVQVAANTHQAFVVELWSRTRLRQVIFYGIETW